jgi:hypothetical protein
VGIIGIEFLFFEMSSNPNHQRQSSLFDKFTSKQKGPPQKNTPVMSHQSPINNPPTQTPKTPPPQLPTFTPPTQSSIPQQTLKISQSPFIPTSVQQKSGPRPQTSLFDKFTTSSKQNTTTNFPPSQQKPPLIPPVSSTTQQIPKSSQQFAPSTSTTPTQQKTPPYIPPAPTPIQRPTNQSSSLFDKFTSKQNPPSQSNMSCLNCGSQPYSQRKTVYTPPASTSTFRPPVSSNRASPSLTQKPRVIPFNYSSGNSMNATCEVYDDTAILDVLVADFVNQRIQITNTVY